MIALCCAGATVPPDEESPEKKKTEEDVKEEEDNGDADPVNERIRMAALRFAEMHMEAIEAKLVMDKPKGGFFSWCLAYGKLAAVYVLMMLPEIMAAFSFYSIYQGYRSRTPKPDPVPPLNMCDPERCWIANCYSR